MNFRLRPELTDELVALLRSGFESRTPRLVTLRGEAGTGKTTLAREIVEDLLAVGAITPDRIARQTSVAAEAGMSFVGLTDLDEDFLRQTQGPPAPLPDDTPATVPALGSAWRRRLQTVCRDLPLVAVLDDIQWLDADSLDVLAFTMRRVRDIPFAVLASVRNDPRTEYERSRGRRGDLPYRHDVELPPVAPARLEALVAELAPTISSAQVREIVDQARGNAFWVSELARGTRTPQGYDLRDASPTALERLNILAADLTDEQRLVVAAIQLVGRPTTEELLAALGADLDDPARAIDATEGAGVTVLAGQRWTTVHPLLGEAALEATPGPQRIAVQRRLVEVVSDDEQRARLLADLERPPHEPTAAALVAAAEAAAARGSLRSAVDLMDRAVDFTDERDGPSVGERQAALVSLHMRLGAFDQVLKTVEYLDLDRLGASAFDTVAAAVADAAMFVHGHAAAQSMVARIQAAADRRGDRMSRAVAQALACDRDYGTASDKYAVAQQAAAVLETAPWPSPTTHLVLGSLCTLQLDRGDGLDEDLVDRRRALEPGLRRVGLTPPSTESADVLRAYVGKQLGDPELSKRELSALIERADRDGEEFAGFAFRVHLALAHQVCGEFEVSGPLIEQAEASLGRVAGPHFPLLLLSTSWQVMAERGAAAAVELVLRETSATPEGSARWRLTADYLLGSAALVTGDAEGALTLLLTARDNARDQLGTTDPSRRLNVDVLIAEVRLALGDLDGAQADTAALLEFARPRGRANLVAAGERLEAQLVAARGDLGAAADALAATARWIARTPYRIEHARTVTALAAVEVARRRRRVATELLDEADRLCAAMPFVAGAEIVARHRAALAELDASRLTPAERQVAEVVATGATARQAGEQLRISPRTVEAHLSAIYRKLEVSGRVGLVALVHRGELDGGS